MFSIMFFVIILFVFVVSFFHSRAGLLALLFLSPFYTILRESSDGKTIFFLWPYTIIAVLIISLVVKYLFYEIPWSHLKKYFLTIGIFFFLLGTQIWLAINSHVYEALWYVDKRLFFRELTPENMVVALVPVILVVLAFFYIYFKSAKRREGRVNTIDIFMAAFFWYGILAILYSCAKGGNVINALDGFRYYFLMSLVYFLCRYLIVPEKYLKPILTGYAIIFALGAIFTLMESYLMNCLHIAPKDLPWSGFLLSEFGYVPYSEEEKAFMSGGYTPMGLIRMTHLSGLFLLLGFLLYLPMALGHTFGKNRILVIKLWLLVALLPIGFLFTSRTVLIGYILGILIVLIMSRQSLKRSLLVLLFVLIIIPYGYSYYLLPGITYDIKSEIGYLLTQKSYGTNALVNMSKMMSKDMVYYIHSPEDTPPSVSAGSKRSLARRFSELVFGTGYSATDWAKKYGNNITYTLQDASDSYYLKVLKQFGLIGLLLFLGIGISLMITSVRLVQISKEILQRSIFVGISAMLLIVFISTIHLGPLFKTGLNTMIYMFMALLASTGIAVPNHNSAEVQTL